MSGKVDDVEDYFQPIADDMEEDSFFELDDGTMQLLEQSGQLERCSCWNKAVR